MTLSSQKIDTTLVSHLLGLHEKNDALDVAVEMRRGQADELRLRIGRLRDELRDKMADLETVITSRSEVRDALTASYRCANKATVAKVRETRKAKVR